MHLLAAVHDTVLKLDPRLLQIGSGILIPLVVGFITKVHAPKWLKAVLNLVLSAIAGALSTALASNGNVLLSTWALGIIQTFVTSIVSYYGLWKPSGAAAAVQGVAPDSGIGQQHPEQYVRDDILPGQPPQASPEVPEPADSLVPPPPTPARASGAKKTTRKGKR
jgi:hypothetical protein